MSPLATRADLESRLQTVFDAPEGVQADLALADVSALVRAKRPNVDMWISNAQISAELVTAVVCQATIRYLSTMDTGGRDVISETVPEHTYLFAKGEASGLSLTSEELDLLTVNEPVGRAFSIIPGF